MTKSVAKALTHEIDDVLDEVVHSLKKLSKHLGDDVTDELSQTTASLADAAVKLAGEAKTKGKALVKVAGKEAREHPAAAAALVAAAVALVGLAVVRQTGGKN